LTNTKQENTIIIAEKNENFYHSIDKHFNFIDSVNKTDPELIEGENLKLAKTINSFKTDVFNLSDTFNYDGLYIVKSSDKKLCLISWDTRMGGTMIEFATMALFQTLNGETISKLLIDSNENQISNTLMHYDNLYCIKEGDQKFYIAHGFGQGSTILAWQELRAFQILGNKINTPLVFPDRKPNLFVEFDLQKLNERKIPQILVLDSGKRISLPVSNDEEGFSGNYQTLVFKNGFYKVN